MKKAIKQPAAMKSMGKAKAQPMMKGKKKIMPKKGMIKGN